MGIESAVYQYVADPSESNLAREALVRLGAVAIDEKHFVLRGPRHWIDAQLGLPEPLVSLRVALCNPIDVLDVLRSVFAGLLRTGGGEILDVATDRRMSALDEGSWHYVSLSYLSRREDFHRLFGDMEAPISADTVFDHVEHNER